MDKRICLEYNYLDGWDELLIDCDVYESYCQQVGFKTDMSEQERLQDYLEFRGQVAAWN